MLEAFHMQIALDIISHLIKQNIPKRQWLYFQKSNKQNPVFIVK